MPQPRLVLVSNINYNVFLRGLPVSNSYGRVARSEESMYVDMHMHQLDYSSDGHQTVSQIIQAAKAAGLMGFCITDHYDKEIAYRPDREEIFPLDRYFAALEPL